MTRHKEKRKSHQTPRKAPHRKVNLYLLFHKIVYISQHLWMQNFFNLQKSCKLIWVLNKKMCFLIACWEQLPSKAQVSRFIPSHSLTDTLDTVDSYPMFLTDTLHILTLFNNRLNCYTLYAVDLYPIFCNRPNCYTLRTVDSYPMFSTQPHFKTMCSDKQSLRESCL